MPLQVGNILLDKYRIERLLGQGGFGYVYEAIDVNLGRRVAIKELLPELTNNPEILERFTREARSIAQLNNPNIVTLMAWEESDDNKYMVMEHMDGGSLADLLSKRGKLSATESAVIAKAVCDGLAAAHQKGIYHRDIKPSNILMTPDGHTIKISDFGIAHVPTLVSGTPDTTHAKGGAGTPWYMSPEQARGETVDQRTDLYSLGVVLYEMTSGYSYLDFTSDLLRDVAKVKNTPPRQMPASVPAGLRQVIFRSLAKDPNARFQSATEMSAALANFVKPDAAISIPKTKTRPVPTSLPETTSGRINLPVIAGVIALGVITIAIIAAAMMIAQPPAPTPTQTKAVAVATSAPTITPAPTQDIRTTIAVAAGATLSFKATLDTQVNAMLTALAPTITPTGTPTPIPSATATGTPTITPTPTATRQLIPLRLLAPTQNQLFNNEKFPPVLEWRASSNQPLTGNEYYRIQVFRPGQLICNDYTRDTTYVLPPTDTLPCKPGLWRYNTGDYSWRISLVQRIDENPEHDIEILNSEGWLFRWLK